MPDTRTPMAEIIRNLRKGRNITIKQMSEDLMISTSAINMWEAGLRKPSRYTQDLLCEYFDVDLNYLNAISEIRNACNSKSKQIPLFFRGDLDSHILLPTRILDETKAYIAVLQADNSYPGAFTGDIVVFEKNTNAEVLKIRRTS